MARVLCFAALACAGVCTRADAGTVREVHVTASGAPFAADELAAALRVRLPAEGAPVDVSVVAAGDDRVTVAVGDTTRDVALAGSRGPAAARLVALAVVDLALDDLAVVPPPAGAPRAWRTRVDVIGSATSWGSLLGGGAADLAVERGRLVAAVELGAAGRVSGDLHVTSVPVRLTAGMRMDQLELRGGAEVVSTWVSDGVGDQVTMLGATASARLHLGRFVLAVGVDAYTTQTTYQLGAPMITTPWIAPWVGAGMELVP